VTLPNGSGAGITALLADTGTKEQINFVRASRLPTAAECATAANTTSNGVNWGSLHVYQFATDGLKVAVSNLVTTQVPVLAKADLTKIYNGTWTTIDDVNAQVVPGAHTGTLLKPYVPQSGSGTRSAFLGDIGVTTLGSNVLTSEEHDPSPIKSDPVALGPFSTGRINMLNGGYFGVANQNTVVTQAGTGPGGAAYALTRGLYVIVRERERHPGAVADRRQRQLRQVPVLGHHQQAGPRPVRPAARRVGRADLQLLRPGQQLPVGAVTPGSGWAPSTRVSLD
jgi:ABC-type phosphate transport system substrate-binding protein